jgi:hypothetical protein
MGTSTSSSYSLPQVRGTEFFDCIFGVQIEWSATRSGSGQIKKNISRLGKLGDNGFDSHTCHKWFYNEFDFQVHDIG